ncbi:polyprenyl synthetase family protein [Kineosporia succinea]
MAMSGPPVLTRARSLVEPALRHTVRQLDPVNRSIAEYHLGWTESDGTPRESSGGKAVRPALALLAAEACGAPAEQAVPAGVAVELVHNFSLIHDDVMDGDTERRHRPTVWAVWGVPSAILTGDALLNLAQDQLALHPQAVRALGSAVRELVRGQTEDLAFERRSWVELDECKAMAAGKTGALLAASGRLGALLAGGSVPMVDALGTYGAHVGMAFQWVDDVLGIWGDPAVTGKPVLSDLRARKKSLPVTSVLSGGGAAAQEVGRWLAGDDPEPDLLRIAGILEDAGARDRALAEAAHEVDLANRALEGHDLSVTALDELAELTRFLTHREA